MRFASPIDDRTIPAFHPLAPIIGTTDAFSSVPLSSSQYTSWSPALLCYLLASSHAEPQPDEARQPRLLFSAHYTHGHFIASPNCGIMAGLAPLWKDEGMEVVDGCLDSICEDPASRTDLVFYDNACRVRRYRVHHPDDSWLGPRQIVDRSQFLSR